MDNVHHIITYLKSKYLVSGRLLEATLQPIEVMQDPRTVAITISNSETVVRLFKLLESHKLEDQVELTTLSLIESKTIRKVDQESYFQELFEKIKEAETPSTPAHESTRVGEIGLGLDDKDPLNLTTEINAANKFAKNTARREFLISYLTKKIPAL